MLTCQVFYDLSISECVLFGSCLILIHSTRYLRSHQSGITTDYQPLLRSSHKKRSREIEKQLEDDRNLGRTVFILHGLWASAPTEAVANWIIESITKGLIRVSNWDVASKRTGEVLFKSICVVVSFIPSWVGIYFILYFFYFIMQAGRFGLRRL